MTTKLIEVKHSTYGVVKLSLEKSDYGSVLFMRNDGSLCGEVDRDRGGNLSHPQVVVEKFLKKMDKHLLEMDEAGYIELENLLHKATDEAFPGFFKEESRP